MQLKPKNGPRFLAAFSSEAAGPFGGLEEGHEFGDEDERFGTRDHLPRAPMRVARGWIYSLRAFSSPLDTQLTMGETA